MANTKSAAKRVRGSEKRHLINQIAKSRFRNAVKKTIVAAKAGEEVSSLLSDAFSKIDKAAKIGAIHSNQAARRKARLVKKVEASKTQAQQ